MKQIDDDNEKYIGLNKNSKTDNIIDNSKDKNIKNRYKKKNIDSENKKRKINKKKIIIAISIGIILLIILITAILYNSSRDVRKFLDQHLFSKNITWEKLESIELNYDSNINVFAFNKHICVLAENKLMQYNSSGTKVDELDLQISDPVYDINNKYLAISEKNGSQINLISDSKILWTKDVEGNISKINVNRNGYVSVIIKNTSYKSVIATFDENGNELFKRYLANNTVVDTSISKDNKYLAFAEVNTTGTTIQSSIKVVSVEKPSEAVIYTFNADNNKLIINIEYDDNNQIICMYDNEITKIQDENNVTLMNLEEKGKNINFCNINLDNYIYRAVEDNEGLFNTNTVIEMKSTTTDKNVVYTVEGAAKAIYSYDNVIAVNLGQEVEFINTSGWLIKRYSSLQEVQSVVIGNKIAGIVYKDKVEIVNL